MDRRINSLLELEKYRAKKKINKVICDNCAGDGESPEHYPHFSCSLCGGTGFIIEEENAK